MDVPILAKRWLSSCTLSQRIPITLQSRHPPFVLPSCPSCEKLLTPDRQPRPTSGITFPHLLRSQLEAHSCLVHLRSHRHSVRNRSIRHVQEIRRESRFRQSHRLNSG